jgi:osmotically inducible lipoprotein OsmB
MGRILYGVAVFGIAAGLAACGETRSDRALSGAAIGAGTGAAVGAAAGGPVGAGTGAAVGAGAGAVTGAVTSPGTIDLGRPAWDR